MTIYYEQFNKYHIPGTVRYPFIKGYMNIQKIIDYLSRTLYRSIRTIIHKCKERTWEYNYAYGDIVSSDNEKLIYYLDTFKNFESYEEAYDMHILDPKTFAYYNHDGNEFIAYRYNIYYQRGGQSIFHKIWKYKYPPIKYSQIWIISKSTIYTASCNDCTLDEAVTQWIEQCKD